jgi:peptidoglycan/LPS O-acetylase OafA/YrhL
LTTVEAERPDQLGALDGVVAVETPAPRRPPRFPAFDGLRAIAMATVLGVHTAFVSGLTFRRPGIGIYTARLEIGVAVFFLISGFLLYRPFAVAHLAAGPRPRTAAFWVRRLLRIVPAYWVALFVTTTIIHATPMGPGGLKAYFTHYLFVQIYFPGEVSAASAITQAWTLCVEMSFYLLLPLYAAAVGRRRNALSANQRFARELVGLVVLVVISLVYRFWDLSLQHHGLIYQYMTVWLPAELDLFSLGMLLAILSAWSHQHAHEPRWMSRWWFPWASWIVAGAAFVGVSHIGVPTSVTYVKSDLDIVRQTLYGVFAFFLLLPAVFGPQRRGAIRRFLCSWPVSSLGVISYGVYLWHQALISELIKYYPRLFGMRLFFNVAFWGMYGEVLGAGIVVASISYFVIEKPALRLKRLRPLDWFKQTSPGADPADGPPSAATA